MLNLLSCLKEDLVPRKKIRKPLWFCWVCLFLLCFAEVSAVFEAGTSVTYTFQEPYPVTKDLSLSSSAIYADAAPSKENIAMSFMTGWVPSLLLFINYSSQDFLAVLLCKNGECRFLGASWECPLELEGSSLPSRTQHQFRLMYRSHLSSSFSDFQPKPGLSWVAIGF